MPELPTHLRGAPMGEQSISREIVAEHQRERVIAKVIPVFAKRGYPETTVDDLLATGKVGAGNFYSLFEGKEECFLAAFDLVVGKGRRAMSEAAAGGGGWAEQTYLGLRSLIAALLDAPLEARLAVLEVQSAGRAAVARYDSQIDEAIAWLARARKLGGAELPASYEQATVFGIAFYLQQCVLHPSDHDANVLLEETSTLLLEPVIGRKALAAVRRSAA
jgi:AcrR family transcriptional regulator